MNPNTQIQSEENVGYLVVRVSTARGAIPLENAAVSIRGSDPDVSGMLFSLITNSDGLTPKATLPAPARSLSQSPENPSPFSKWSIDVFKEGYIPVSYTDVPVYASIVSVQPAVMLPLPENFVSPQIFNETPAPEL